MILHLLSLLAAFCAGALAVLLLPAGETVREVPDEQLTRRLRRG